jgi:hypothetical protein
MTQPAFEIELHRRGVIIWRGSCAAVPAACYGIYRILNGCTHVLLPDDAQLRDALPYHYRKAFDRAIHWWIDKNQYSDVTRTDLRDWQGFPMGTIIARLPGAA